MKRILLPLLAMTTLNALPAADQPALENIALHKPYTWNVPPDYSYCLDPDDKIQLTDGYRTPETDASGGGKHATDAMTAVAEGGTFWTKKTTVGWGGASPLVITVDLGEPQPIRGASYNTAAGVSGVEFPQAIYVLVSDDNKTFYEAGELLSLSDTVIPESGYAVRRFWTDQLQTHGRYVAFVVVQTCYLFCDEIEVYQGDAALLKTPLAGQPIADIKAFVEGGEDGRLTQFTKLSLKRELRLVRESVASSGLARERREELGAKLDELKAQVTGIACRYSPEYRAILPLHPLQEEVFRVQARLWEALGHRGVTAWPAGPWDPLATTQVPPKESPVGVDAHLMPNEFRAAAFNVSNAAPDKKSLRLKITGLPGGANPGYIQVHQGIWTVPAKGVPIVSALPEVKRDKPGYLIDVPSGLTQQMWLTFHPTEVEPGEYRGKITLNGKGVKLTVPVTLRVASVRFPDRPTLHLGGWDYMDKDALGTTPENRAAILQHLREHFVDSPWGGGGVLTPGKYDAQGKMIAEPDTAAFDRWLKDWPEARQSLVFAAVGDQFEGSPKGSPEFDRKVGAWATFWARHMERRGRKPEQLCVLLVDEPGCVPGPGQGETILAWTRAIRAAKAGLRIWEDPAYADPGKENQEWFTACDVLCPGAWTYWSSPGPYRKYYDQRREQGTELAFYLCAGPVCALDPYAYHRLLPWVAWTGQAKSVYIWALTCVNGWERGSSWYEKKYAYAPYFLDEKSVTPGKPMEALREGVEDYEYFVMLREAVAKAEQGSKEPGLIKNAKELLAQAAPEVLGQAKYNDSQSTYWLTPKDRAVADQFRLKVLAAIEALEK